MHRIRRLAPWLSALALALIVAAGPGTRLGLWDFRAGFQLLRLGAYLGLAGAGLGLVGLLWRPAGTRVHRPLIAIGLGAIAALIPWTWMQQARRVPPIHDITTDTERPPEFFAVLPLRAGAPNSAEYAGEEVAVQQRAAYPDITPLRLERPPAEAYARALAAARESGWEIVAADSAAGRIEATATSAWFGFKDDVVIRVTPEGNGSRIDARSVSRVGTSDVGANAKRIRGFFRRLRPAR